MPFMTRRIAVSGLIGCTLAGGLALSPDDAEALTRAWFVDSAFFRKGRRLHLWVRLINRANANSDVPFQSSLAHSASGSQSFYTQSATSQAALSHNTRLVMPISVVPSQSSPVYCCIQHPSGGTPVNVLSLRGIHEE